MRGFGRHHGSKLAAINRRLSRSPQTASFVRRSQDICLLSELLGSPVRLSLNSRFPVLTAENKSRNVLRNNESLQRLLRFQRHRSANCPDRGTEFGWREGPS